jgi:UDP-N-acetylmuramoyl-tripeptide--D-alanyl-D-alanine ligase
MFGQLLLGAGLLVWGIRSDSLAAPYVGAALLISAPILWSHLVIVPLLLGKWLITTPIHKSQIRKARRNFAKHPAIKIAIAGSYGKTTMKEMLLKVFGGKKVAATPGNKNVSISHARFSKNLQGDEEVLLIEFGEGKPGDVAKFARNTKPTIGIITGLAPAHLDRYKTLDAAGRDIFSLEQYLDQGNIYVNGENESLAKFTKKSHHLYSSKQVLGWKIENIKISSEGVYFIMRRGKEELKVKSQLLGKHQVGPLALAAALAERLGVSKQDIEARLSQIKSFEHRMAPYDLSGARVIDDTYNGNIEGMKAGLELLSDLPAKRKIYVTPGLVDQGENSAQIHRQLGNYIAKAKPDLVVLMEHSVTRDIANGLKEGGYKGELIVEDDPLEFYTNLKHFVAAGDLVLLQNDWSDNYN